MKRLLTLTLVFSLHLFLCVFLRAESNVRAFRLPNGLRVILAPVDHIDAACVLLYHLTGVRDDPPAVKGGSYLYQNLMLRGTRNLDRFERLVFIKRSGGFSNRLVSYDNSIFYQIVPATEVNNALWLESERIGSLDLAVRNINAEKNYVYTRNYRLNNSNINFQAMTWVKSRIFAGTIYETPLYGSLEEIRGFDPRKIRKLYNNFRNLSNIIMVVAGKFDPAEIRRTVNKHFAGLNTPLRPAKKNFVPVGPRTQYEYKNMVLENLEQPFVLYAIRAPSKLSHDHLFFDFLRFYLADERISKLEVLLNQDNRLDADISYYLTDYYECNALVIKIACKNRVNLERAKYFFNKLLNAIKKGKPGIVSGNDVKTTKSLMAIDFLKRMASLYQRSQFLAETYHFSGNLNAEKRYITRIRNIKVYDIYRIGRKYLDKNNRVNLNVYPK